MTIEEKTKLFLFISYSNNDIEKVNLIKKELEDHFLFEPIIIASNREALKPLVVKVTEGIHKSTVIIPILTTNSISTQWINQEIGYAMGTYKKLYPIVESSLLNQLKGFIHKEIDLPYKYQDNPDKKIENEGFLNSFRILLVDLEKEFNPYKKIEPTKKTDFEKSLEKVKETNIKSKILEEKRKFLGSYQGVNAALKTVLDMFNDLKQKLDIIGKNELEIFKKEQHNPPTLEFGSFGYFCTITWELKWADILDGAELIIVYFKKKFTAQSEKRIQIIKKEQYTFDATDNSEIGKWINTDKKIYTSEQIESELITWLVDNVSDAKLNLS